MIQKNKNDDANWEYMFKKAKLSTIPYPSKLSLEFYQKIKPYLPKSAKVLEAGSGSGEMSAYLSKKGFETHLLDNSSSALTLSKRLFRKYKLKGTFTKGDLFSIPYPDNSFDCVWNSGVLEHFEHKKIVQALREMSRVSNNYVISLVPNSFCIAYRVAKWQLEKNGNWLYGFESPKKTLAPLFEKAGLAVSQESYVGSYFGTMWLNEILNINDQLLDKLARLTRTLNRGLLIPALSYLLLTVGTNEAQT